MGIETLLAVPVLVAVLGAGKWVGTINEAVRRIDQRLNRIEDHLGVPKGDDE